MLGKLLDGRYHVNQILGAGGFGRTYLAQDTRRPGNPICVVKHLQPANRDPNFLETARRLFTSEAETLEQLGNHDQIPRLLAYFEEDQEFYLVQEFIEGHTLSQELPPGQRWEEGRVIELLQEVLTILDFVHHHGVIHRDIKPDNLIRRKSDHKLVLVDFGAVKQIRSQLASNYGSVNNTVAVGTPGYMSSEQAMGQPRPSSDIYGLGIIGIQALTGRMPIELQEDLNTGEILWQHLVPVSRGLANILSQMLRYHFKERYHSAGEALQALRHLSPYPPSHHPTNPAYLGIQGVSPSRQTLPPPNPAPLSEQATMAVAPAALPRTPAPTPPSPPPASKSDKLPLVLGLGLAVLVGGVSMAYAIRQGALNAIGTGKPAQAGNCTVVADALNVRSKPQGTILNTVNKGTNLALTGTKQNGWVEIKSPMQGWVFEQHVNCSSSPTVAQTQPSPTPVETPPTPTPVETPTPQKSPDQPKPVDNGASTLTKAAEKYQQGKLDEAIAEAQSVLPGSAAFKDAQERIQQWQQEWSAAQDQFNKIQQAFDEGRYIDVLIHASDSQFPEQRYWRERLNGLVREATKRKAESDANQQTPPSPAPPQTENPKPEPQESVTPSPQPTGDDSATLGNPTQESP